MGEGFGVDPAMLARTAEGIRGAVDTLGEVGHGYLAESGRGLEFLALGGEESGHPMVAEALDGFVERWSWGIRTLVRDGQAVGQALDATGVEYDGVDDSAGDPAALGERAQTLPRFADHLGAAADGLECIDLDEPGLKMRRHSALGFTPTPLRHRRRDLIAQRTTARLTRG